MSLDTIPASGRVLLTVNVTDSRTGKPPDPSPTVAVQIYRPDANGYTPDAMVQLLDDGGGNFSGSYHVVPGRLTSIDLKKQIEAGGGQATLRTASGESLTVRGDGDDVVLVDEKGDSSRITIANVMQSNGVIHVVDTVMLPN